MPSPCRYRNARSSRVAAQFGGIERMRSRTASRARCASSFGERGVLIGAGSVAHCVAMRRGALWVVVLVAVTGAALAAGAGSASADVVWLCQPGQQDNPCRDSLETTVYGPD